MIDCSPSTVYALMREGTLEYVRIGNRRKLRVADVQAYVKELFAQQRRARGEFLASVV